MSEENFDVRCDGRLVKLIKQSLQELGYNPNKHVLDIEASFRGVSTPEDEVEIVPYVKIHIDPTA